VVLFLFLREKQSVLSFYGIPLVLRGKTGRCYSLAEAIATIKLSRTIVILLNHSRSIWRCIKLMSIMKKDFTGE
jgi:hypothetical protein